ncbi:hypothetical protein Rsub_08364 [Raphidocelis subcapitata]|uniref:Uncharacterized protein n=1 Tax=Raphidocelis subcapitata TaxID=307507 RepID=A0A2V0P8Y0_9CHLO|nr:hypothetical protein Rsub_08364 [Raphidocelis subcapitata]|eukprot:GBF95402.1 hypothetical protein Rsub_08364 [Raphidocelis subcapitata]
MWSPFVAAPPAGVAGLQRQSSLGAGTLRTQTSGGLQRQPSGTLRTQGSLRGQGSLGGALPSAASLRRPRTSLCAGAGDGPGGLAGEPVLDQWPSGPAAAAAPLPAAALPAAAQHPFAVQRDARARPQQPDPAEVEAMLADSVEGLSTPNFDTYALRHLVRTAPAKTAHLSSLSLGPARALRRFAVQSPSGERCVMTLTFERADAGAAAAAPDAPSAFGAGRTAPAGGWALVAAAGEPAAPELPRGPAPEHPPEAVVAAQLEALAALDALTAWRLVGLGGRAAYGGAPERFYAALEAPGLAPLLMHSRSATVMRRQRSGTVYSEVSRVWMGGGEWRDYCWTLSLQQDGPFEGCWMVESLRPVDTAGCAHAGPCGESYSLPSSPDN